MDPSARNFTFRQTFTNSKRKQEECVGILTYFCIAPPLVAAPQQTQYLQSTA